MILWVIVCKYEGKQDCSCVLFDLIYKGQYSPFPHPIIIFGFSELGLLPVLPGNGILGSNFRQ